MDYIDLIVDIQKRNSERVFLIDAFTGEEVTFGQLHHSACAIAADLKRRGLNKGDRVAILLQNSLDYARIYFACLYSGIVTIPINTILNSHEIDFIVRGSKVRSLIVSIETLYLLPQRDLLENGAEVLILPAINEKTNIPKRSEIWDINSLPIDNRFVPFESISQSDTMTIVFTSGTTALPKGVVHKIADLFNNGCYFTKALGLGPDNRFYGILSLAYLGGYYNLLIIPFIAESSIVLSRAFDARSAIDFWTPAIKHGVNTLWLVPTIMSILMEMDRGNIGEKFCKKNVKCSLVGTAPLPNKLKRDFEDRYGLTLWENYGLSETLFVSTNSHLFPSQEDCVGRLLPGIQVTILNNDGIAVPYGEEGEIFISSPALMAGYYHPDTKIIEPLQEGAWFPSGDLGVLSATGDLFISGRKKDLIIRGGINVSPASIENVLCQHPSISQCAVVGIPHQIYGEEIAAVIKLKNDIAFEIIQSELIAYCKNNLNLTQQPAKFLEIEELPLSSSGKVQKSKLREILISKLGLHEILLPRPQIIPSNKKVALQISGRVRKTFMRPDPNLIESLKKFPTSLISDCFNRLGVMDSSVHSIISGRSFCGPALTVEEVEGGNLMSHVALELLQSGDVLVIDGKGVTTRSCWGGLQTFMAKIRGAVGIVIYGTIRDVEEIVKCGIPVFAIGTSPGGPLKGWSGNVNYPISCAGIVINPGDIIFGDDDGVVVVPKATANKIVQLCEERNKIEKQWYDSIAKGGSTLDAVGLRNKLDDFNIIYE